MSQCKLYLENYGGTYYAGSEIRGRIECYFDEAISVRGIKVNVICKEHNSWNSTETYTDPVDNKTKTRHVTLFGDNNVLFIEQMLFGSDSGNRVISVGRHVYPFIIRLPYDIPSSFRGPHGSITYTAKVIVDRPMAIDYQDDFIFLVKSPIDFNHMSKDLQDTSSYSNEKTVCCWCCTGGHVEMIVELPKRAFVPGEKIPLKVHIVNMSNSNVDGLELVLKKTITYRVTSPTSESKTDVDKILSISDHGVGAHGEHTFEIQVAIPNYVDVPNFTKCQLFKVSYDLNVTAEMPSCTMDLEVNMWDIEMGHVQYVDNTQSAVGGTTHLPMPEFSSSLPYAAPGGNYPPVNLPPPPGVVYPGFSDKLVPIPGQASAPSAPFDGNPKAREGARSTPSAPSDVPDLPPPSYDQVQQNTGFTYPPQK